MRHLSSRVDSASVRPAPEISTSVCETSSALAELAATVRAFTSAPASGYWCRSIQRELPGSIPKCRTVTSLGLMGMGKRVMLPGIQDICKRAASYVTVEIMASGIVIGAAIWQALVSQFVRPKS